MIRDVTRKADPRERPAREWAKRLDCRLQRRAGTFKLVDQRIKGTVFLTTTDLRPILRKLAELSLAELSLDDTRLT
jgi:hypothetical protein